MIITPEIAQQLGLTDNQVKELNKILAFINVKSVTELTAILNPVDGFFPFEGPDGKLYKVPINTFYQLIGGMAKPISPTDPAPIIVGWYKPTTYSEDPGTNYPNLDDLKAIEGFDTLFYFDGTEWVDIVNRMPQAKKNIVNFPDIPSGDFPLVNVGADKIQVVQDFVMYQLKDGETATSTDMPGDSDKWDMLSKKELLETDDADSFYFVDGLGNIAVKITQDGKLDAIDFGVNLTKRIKYLSNGVFYTVNNVLAVYNHIINYGQSLSVGQTEKIITSTQPSERLFCLDGVVRTSEYDKSLTGDIYPINRRISFQPLVERVNDGADPAALRETPSSGIGEMFQQSFEVFSEFDKNIVVTSPGWGGRTIAQLSKGGDGYYNRIIEDVTAAKALAEDEGKDYKCLSVTWTQGESDYLANTPKATYKSLLQTLVNDLNTDIKAVTGQSEDVILVCYQLATSKPGLNDFPYLALALFEMSQSDSRIYLATPMYQMNYNDGFHLKAESSKLLGAYYGNTIFKILVEKIDWKPLHIKTKAVTGNIITLNYHVPYGNLVFDNPNGINLPNKGFTFSDNSNIISSVTILDNKVVINCSSSPSGKTLQYATAFQTVPNTQLNIGCLRDSEGENRSMLIDGEIKKMHNWAVIQEIII